MNEGGADHVYDEAPLAVNVVVFPEQIVVFPETATIGFGNTITEIVFVEVHPDPLKHVTVYIVLEIGFTTIVEPVAPPGVQV